MEAFQDGAHRGLSARYSGAPFSLMDKTPEERRALRLSQVDTHRVWGRGTWKPPGFNPCAVSILHHQLLGVKASVTSGTERQEIATTNVLLERFSRKQKRHIGGLEETSAARTHDVAVLYAPNRRERDERGFVISYS